MYSFETFKNLPNIIDIIILVSSLIYLFKWQNKNAYYILHNNRTNIAYWTIFCIILSLLFGLRPIPPGIQADTSVYAMNFNIIKRNGVIIDLDESEWFFTWLMKVCGNFGDTEVFFSTVAFGYVFFAFWGIYRIFKNDTNGALVFYIGAFSFFSYATNGIRNGLACAMIICAISYAIIPKHRNWLIAVSLSLLAIAVHKSVTLPIVCLIAAYFIKDIQKAIGFWVFSIFLFIVAHGPIESFFANLGFDDRLTSYINSAESYAAMGLKSGFRIDFLIYSFMPIWLGWAVTKRLGNKVDKTYQLLLNTYIFANAFWVMLMNAAYSNRFAYLSWFLYPIVLAYPCLRMNVWGERQGRVAGNILVAHSAFTTFMDLIYYGALF